MDVPELPEVESVRRQLAPRLTGRRVDHVWWDQHPRARFHAVARMQGNTIEAVTRRGKFLVLPLEATSSRDRLELILHLGMTGSLTFGSGSSTSPAAERSAGEDGHHVRARLALDDGSMLLFRDPRRFGRLSVVPAGAYAELVPTLATIGPEPLSPAFTVTDFATALARTRAPIKAKLLDQRLVAGIGNIYADEALWRARIHPATRRVGRDRAARLHAAILAVLTAAIEREGTTFRDYQLVNGASGRYADHLEAYGRGGLPCRRCGTTLQRRVIAQRGTTFCPRCQRV
ncbi:MAG: bifunctional DNA-formamidopyrimidine glycosylase/DNA-(apurinic or apyrimidinic site) lyase [Nitriliruptoraceae bacterium]